MWFIGSFQSVGIVAVKANFFCVISVWRRKLICRFNTAAKTNTCTVTSPPALQKLAHTVTLKFRAGPLRFETTELPGEPSESALPPSCRPSWSRRWRWERRPGQAHSSPPRACHSRRSDCLSSLSRGRFYSRTGRPRCRCSWQRNPSSSSYGAGPATWEEAGQ